MLFRSNVFNAFQNFLDNAKDGETFYVYIKKRGNDQHFYNTPTAEFCRVERSGYSQRTEIYPRGPFEFVDKETSEGYERRFFRFFGQVNQFISSSNVVKRSGNFELTYSRPLEGGMISFKIVSLTPQIGNEMKTTAFEEQEGLLVSKMSSTYTYYAKTNMQV